MPGARYVVKKGSLFADGRGGWTSDPLRAFIFADAIDGKGPFAKGDAWAHAHADHCRRIVPKGQRGHVEVKPAPPACFANE
jgi:hypothetical protein